MIIETKMFGNDGKPLKQKVKKISLNKIIEEVEKEIGE